MDEELHRVLAFLQASGYEDAVNAILVQQQQQQHVHQRGASASGIR